MNWKHILDRLEYWREQDNIRQEAFDSLIKVFAPKEHTPILNSCYSECYIDGVAKDAEMKEWLEYYIYEVPNMERADVKANGRIYNFRKKKEVIRFFEDSYKPNNTH